MDMRFTNRDYPSPSNFLPAYGDYRTATMFVQFTAPTRVRMVGITVTGPSDSYGIQIRSTNFSEGSSGDGDYLLMAYGYYGSDPFTFNNEDSSFEFIVDPVNLPPNGNGSVAFDMAMEFEDTPGVWIPLTEEFADISYDDPSHLLMGSDGPPVGNVCLWQDRVGVTEDCDGAEPPEGFYLYLPSNGYSYPGGDFLTPAGESGTPPGFVYADFTFVRDGVSYTVAWQDDFNRHEVRLTDSGEFDTNSYDHVPIVMTQGSNTWSDVLLVASWF
jgi:hypothetical protein